MEAHRSQRESHGKAAARAAALVRGRSGLRSQSRANRRIAAARDSMAAAVNGVDLSTWQREASCACAASTKARQQTRVWSLPEQVAGDGDSPPDCRAPRVGHNRGTTRRKQLIFAGQH